jgi:hypothetical protein
MDLQRTIAELRQELASIEVCIATLRRLGRSEARPTAQDSLEASPRVPEAKNSGKVETRIGEVVAPEAGMLQPMKEALLAQPVLADLTPSATTEHGCG